MYSTLNTNLLPASAATPPLLFQKADARTSSFSTTRQETTCDVLLLKDTQFCSNMSRGRDHSENPLTPPPYSTVFPITQPPIVSPLVPGSHQHRVGLHQTRGQTRAQKTKSIPPFRRNTHNATLRRNEPQIEECRRKRPIDANLAQKIEEKVWQFSSVGGWRRWVLEVISWIVSAVCFAVVMLILLFYQNKQSPSWPLPQTLNLISRVASAALILPVSEALGQLKWNWFQKSKKMWDFEIFDNASRGPWGSAILLIRTKGR